jgi:hypothetical protein
MTHVVNVAMGLKGSAVRYLIDGRPDHRSASDHALEHLDRYHGPVHGMFSGDEWLAGPAANRGVELCAVVEAMFSLEQMLRAWGDAGHADRLEGLAYNLLPAALTADMTAHQYHQQANQVLVTIDQREWTQAGDDCLIFGLEPNFGCCTANLHQGWPKFVRSLWMASLDGGLVAVAHGPSTVRWDDEHGRVAITAVTDYPFEETISYEIRVSGPVAFPLHLRVPGWCTEPELTIGADAAGAVRDGYLTVQREWHDGDLLRLRLPMTPRAIPRPAGSVGLALGPLVLAFSPGETWHRLPGSADPGDWEVRPRRSWNMALAVDVLAVAEAARVERMGPVQPPFGLRTGAPPYGLDGVPLKVWVPGRRAPSWRLERNSAADPPAATVEAQEVVQPGPLVPYGSARIRISEFPLVSAEAS